MVTEECIFSGIRAACLQLDMTRNSDEVSEMRNLGAKVHQLVA